MQGAGSTKLPSIMKRTTGGINGYQSSGSMLMGMMGVKEKKHMARDVSEAALKLISALDKVE